MRKVHWARLASLLLTVACVGLAARVRSLALRLEALEGSGEWRIVDYELSSGSPAAVTLEQAR